MLLMWKNGMLLQMLSSFLEYIFLPLMRVISVISGLIMRSRLVIVWQSALLWLGRSASPAQSQMLFFSDLGKGRNFRPEAWGWRDYNRWLPQDSVLIGNWYTGAKNHALSRMKDERKNGFHSFSLIADCEVIDVIVKTSLKKQNIFANA